MVEAVREMRKGTTGGSRRQVPSDDSGIATIPPLLWVSEVGAGALNRYLTSAGSLGLKKKSLDIQDWFFQIVWRHLAIITCFVHQFRISGLSPVVVKKGA